MVTVMELLVRPLRIGARAPFMHVRAFLTHYPNLFPMPIDLTIAQEAASTRASFHLSSPDALIVGTGLVAQVGHIVTNDRQWRRRFQPIADRIKVCYLSDHLPFP
jgi:hypothetical protein